MSKFILVDGNNLFHRINAASSASVDMKTGMTIHITLTTLKKVWNLFDPDHIVVAFDQSRSWRESIYPEYKAHRRLKKLTKTEKERNEDKIFFQAMDKFKEYLETKTNISVLTCQGIEADDLLARWIQLHPEDNHVLMSGDSDYYQLLADNVKLYDATKKHIISIDSITDEKGGPVYKTIKVNKKNAAGKKIKVEEKYQLTAPDPQYELFKKIIRGDSSDNIMSAYPGVKEKGTKKSTGIIECFNDRIKKSYHWNSFMFETWDKFIGTDANGSAILKKVKVKDEYLINESLIDLTKQPSDIIKKMDDTIIGQIKKEPVTQVGIWLLKFTKKMNLPTIQKFSKDYAAILAAGYPDA